MLVGATVPDPNVITKIWIVHVIAYICSHIDNVRYCNNMR